MAWLPHGGIAGLALASLAAFGCEAEGGGQPGSPSGGAAPSTGGSASLPGASRFLQDAIARPTPLRRLTRAEYGNIVHDLLGVAAPAAALLPDDSLSSGFTSTAGQLVTIASASRYLDAASDVSTRVEPTVNALVPCASPGMVDTEASCVGAFLSATGSRLFRRPITEGEKARYVAAFRAARLNDGYERSASLVVEALLVAPEFLFVEEPSGGAAGTRHALDSWQVASRLSLLLWDSLPDAPLNAPQRRSSARG